MVAGTEPTTNYKITPFTNVDMTDHHKKQLFAAADGMQLRPPSFPLGDDCDETLHGVASRLD